ncbi:MAG: hypothetical protein HY319_19325 [Armatimonadetes bacterium]|nr:hypothetical protein [Armatimonadota bacterium]
MSTDRLNVGQPAHAILSAVARIRSDDRFAGVRWDAIDYYCDRLLMGVIPQELDAALTTEALEALSPDVVKAALIMLIRDFARRYHDRLVPPEFAQNWAGHWVEQLTVGLLEATGAPVEPYVRWMAIVRDEPEDPRRLVVGLARQLGLEPNRLWELHAGLGEAIERDVLSPRNSSPPDQSTGTQP